MIGQFGGITVKSDDADASLEVAEKLARVLSKNWLAGASGKSLIVTVDGVDYSVSEVSLQ